MRSRANYALLYLSAGMLVVAGAFAASDISHAAKQAEFTASNNDIAEQYTQKKQLRKRRKTGGGGGGSFSE